MFASAAKGKSLTSSTSSSRADVLTFSCLEQVVQRISTLFGDERLSDVTFFVQCGEDSPAQRFVAHRSIVSAWSRPLERMLCGNFSEGTSSQARLFDVEPSAFEVMLKLMYTGQAEINPDNVLAILDVSTRFDVSPLTEFSVQFLQSHICSEHACRILEVGVQYGLPKLVDSCIELIVTEDFLLASEDFCRLSRAAILEMAKHDSWNLNEDDIYDTLARWAHFNSSNEQHKYELMAPITEHMRYPYMSIDKLKVLSTSSHVPHQLIFEALFFKLQPPVNADLETSPMTRAANTGHVWRQNQPTNPNDVQRQSSSRFRARSGSLLFSWVPTNKITVSGDRLENARHTSSSAFTGVRGNRRMLHGTFSWTVEIVETQSSWIFIGIAHADDANDVAWRSSGHMLYCLDSRFFHQGSGQNHPCGDRSICSGDRVHVVLDCSRHTLAFGINDEEMIILFRNLEHAVYVPAVDLRDCGDKIRILRGRPQLTSSSSSNLDAAQTNPTRPQGQLPVQSPSAPSEPQPFFQNQPQGYPNATDSPWPSSVAHLDLNRQQASNAPDRSSEVVLTSRSAGSAQSPQLYSVFPSQSGWNRVDGPDASSSEARVDEEASLLMASTILRRHFATPPQARQQPHDLSLTPSSSGSSDYE